AVHPPASPAIRDGRHRERHDSPRLCFPSVPCVAQHRPRSRTTKRPGPGHLSPPVGGGWPATGNDRWSRPANAPRHRPPWASMAEHLRPSTERPGHRATTEHATRRAPPTPRRRQSRDKARQAHAGSTTAMRLGGAGRPSDEHWGEAVWRTGDPAPPDPRRKQQRQAGQLPPHSNRSSRSFAHRGSGSASCAWSGSALRLAPHSAHSPAQSTRHTTWAGSASA
ncbi:MAG: hypothetical protein QOG70_571, partial [Solirubrobacteraceae bacterium]|nr:hypothetical protein [Solirubrobacteraceae bacterium]